MKKYIRIFLFLVLGLPCGAYAASNEFMAAAQLLAAARNSDIQQVQILVNNGANINFVDSTGLSLVCTALMNNDVRAAQILQMYGADASKCDQQIKQYNKRNTQQRSGGLFSGLSSTHTLTLAAAGAAVVVGGLLLLTDVLDFSNDNDSGSSGSNRPNGNNGGSTTDPTTSGDAIPVGPAYFTTDGLIAYSTAAYQENLSTWNPNSDNTGLRSRDFNFFRPDLMVPNPASGSTGTIQNPESYVTAGITVPMQNYLLMMHGYAAFANGYLGHFTFRDNAHNPVRVLNETGGGVPVTVGLITSNGINAVGSAGRSDGIVYAASANASAATTRVDKYLNYLAPDGSENTLGAEKTGFDLSNSGTAMNPFVSANDNALAKIVAGWEGARPDTDGAGDLYGFVPNGRLGVWRTGGGYEWVALETPTTFGQITKASGNTDATLIQAGDSIVYDGHTYTVSVGGTGVTNPTVTIGDSTFSIAPGTTIWVAKCTGTDCDDVSDMALYLGTDNKYYINYSGQNRPDAVLVVDGTDLKSTMEWKQTVVKNYQALASAVATAIDLPEPGGTRTTMAAIANTALNPESRNNDYFVMSSIPGLATSPGVDLNAAFVSAINKYYEGDETSTRSQGIYANELFGGYSSGRPIIVNPAGEFLLQNADGWVSPVTLEATFENYAPAVYSALNHSFMTVVAVRNITGTAAAGSIDAYGNGTGSAYGKFYFSFWNDGDDIYQSRKCGVAGMGINGIDPWCFAASGPTTEMATASAAGAVAALRAAFSYMTNDNIFTLMALTADGAYLGTNPVTGLAWGSNTADATAALVAYLNSMYQLPPEYRADETLAGDDWLRAFQDLYGYGLINLERAMTPGKKIYYYDGNKIVSSSGNAFWRASSNTTFRASNVLNPRAASISASFFDVLESVDGSLRMPRVWENTFALTAQTPRGLYMGDVFDDLKLADAPGATTQIGDVYFSMSTSRRAYADNMGGLDTLQLGMTRGNWDVAAGYQNHFTDGAGLFSGMANPILSIASNAVTSDATYHSGKWSFGGRVFSGAITDRELLESDPTLTSQFTPARLGAAYGAAASLGWHGKKFATTASIGNMRESDTVLGAYADGLLGLSDADTIYADALARYDFSDDLTMSMRATFARTNAAADGEYMMGLTPIDSDAFAVGMRFKNFELVLSRPLAVRSGYMRYAHADYDVVESDDGGYDIVYRDMRAAELSLRPVVRESRVAMTYRHRFGEFTSGAVGLIYRINPNNTDDFGNESVFMFKLSHRLGI
ncbi:hypothetical protein HDR66_02645 [bacterium]|nr:hypothetical protein [bacterium]